MQIKTRDQQVTPKELFKLAVFWQMRATWLLFAVLFLFGVFLREPFLMFFCVVFPLLILWGFYRSLNGKANRFFYMPRHYEMDDQYFCTFLQDGGFGKVGWDHFYRCVRYGKSYLLFLSETQFHLMPYSIFFSEADREAFEAFLKERKILQTEKKKMGWSLRVFFEVALFLIWFLIVLLGLVFVFTELYDAVSVSLLAFLVVLYPAFQIVRLVRRLLRKKESAK